MLADSLSETNPTGTWPWLLAALLYVRLHEFFGIGFENLVDLVEDVIETVGQGLVLRCWFGYFGRLLGLGGSRGLAFLLFSHKCFLSYVLGQP